MAHWSEQRSLFQRTLAGDSEELRPEKHTRSPRSFSRRRHSLQLEPMRLKTSLLHYYTNNMPDNFCSPRRAQAGCEYVFVYLFVYLDSVVWHPAGRSGAAGAERKTKLGIGSFPPRSGLCARWKRGKGEMKLYYSSSSASSVSSSFSSRNWKRVSNTNHNYRPVAPFLFLLENL